MYNDTLATINQSEFERKVDMNMINEVSNEALNNERIEIPQGEYIVAITNMELGKTRQNKNALKVEFTIADGEYRGRKLYYTQVLTVEYTIKIAVDFLNSLKTEYTARFTNIDNFGIDVKAIFVNVKDSNEFDLKYHKNDRGFSEYKITGIYDLQ
jgi:hypothetical protein